MDIYRNYLYSPKIYAHIYIFHTPASLLLIKAFIVFTIPIWYDYENSIFHFWVTKGAFDKYDMYIVKNTHFIDDINSHASLIFEA